MAFACSLQSEARESRPLTDPNLALLYGGPLAAAAVQLVRQKLPKLQITFIDEPGNLRRGWVDEAGMVLNVAHGLRADTPLHEMQHLLLAVVRAQKGAAKREWLSLLTQLNGTRQHLALADLYPLSESYRASDQLEEVATQLVGEAAAKRLRYDQNGIVGRLHRFLEELMSGLLALSGGKRALAHSLSQAVNAMADDLIRQGVAFDGEMTHLLQVAKEQRVDMPLNTAELMSRISGQGTGSNDAQMIKQAEPYLQLFRAGADELPLPSLLGGPDINEPIAGMSETQVLDMVVEHLRQYEQASRGASRASAMNLLSLPPATLAKVLGGDYGELVDTPEFPLDAQVALAMELGRVFTDVQENDIITEYGPNNPALPDGLYDAAKDSGSLVVHLKPRINAQGQAVTEAVLVSMDSQRLTESEDKPLLNGLYSGSWLKAAQGLAVRKRGGVELTGSSRDRQLMEVTMAAMHFTSQGLMVTGIGVVKVDLNSTPLQQRNDARLVPITQYLDTWKALGDDPGVQKLLPQSVREQLKDAKSLDYKSYEIDYPTVLERYAQGNYDLRKVALALGEYEAAGRKNNVRGVITSIENRLQELKKSYGLDTKGFSRNPEVAMLGETLRQLGGVEKLINKHKDIGQFEKFFAGFNAGDNPHIQWFYQEWRIAREKVTKAYLTYQEGRISATNKLRDDYHRRNGMTSKLRHEEHLYYKELLHHQTVDYTDKKGIVRQMEVNEHRFKMPGTPEFERLQPAQKEYIQQMLGSMKEVIKARYLQSQNWKTDSDFEKWYQKNWGQGYLPLTPGSSWKALSTDDISDQGLDKFESMLDQNYLYDRQDNANLDTLSDKYGYQGGPGRHGSDTRLKMLGLMEVSSIDSNGARVISYTLDPEGGRRRQLSLETDLRKSLDQFHMSYFKNLMLNQLHVKKLTAVAMIRAGFRESGLLRGRKEDSEKETPGENTSTAEEYLNTMYQMLVLSRRDNMRSGPGMKRASLMLSTLGSIASFGGLGFSIKTAATSTTAAFFAGIGVGLTNWGRSNGLSAESMGRAMKELCTQRGKMWAVCKALRTLEMDEYALLESRWMDGQGTTGRTLSDLPGESFIMDKVGNIALTMWLTASQMMQDGTWEVYQFDEKTGTLTYDEAAHRKLKGDAHVDAIRQRMESTGDLLPGEVMPRGHDDRMRGAIEAWNAEVLGGYKDEVDTTLGSNILLRSVRKFRTYAVKKIDNLTKDRHFNPNMGYLDDDGTWVSREEVGMFTSMIAFAGGVHYHHANLRANWQSLSEADRYNLRKLSYNSLIAATALLVAGAAFGDEEEDDNVDPAVRAMLDAQIKENKKRKSISEAALNSVIQENFLLFELSDDLRIVQSPFTSVVMAGRLSSAVVDYVTGDFESGNRVMVRNLGPLKTASWLAGFVPESK